MNISDGGILVHVDNLYKGTKIDTIYTTSDSHSDPK